MFKLFFIILIVTVNCLAQSNSNLTFRSKVKHCYGEELENIHKRAALKNCRSGLVTRTFFKAKLLGQTGRNKSCSAIQVSEVSSIFTCLKNNRFKSRVKQSDDDDPRYCSYYYKRKRWPPANCL